MLNKARLFFDLLYYGSKNRKFIFEKIVFISLITFILFAPLIFSDISFKVSVQQSGYSSAPFMKVSFKVNEYKVINNILKDIKHLPKVSSAWIYSEFRDLFYLNDSSFPLILGFNQSTLIELGYSPDSPRDIYASTVLVKLYNLSIGDKLNITLFNGKTSIFNLKGIIDLDILFGEVKDIFSLDYIDYSLIMPIDYLIDFVGISDLTFELFIYIDYTKSINLWFDSISIVNLEITLNKVVNKIETLGGYNVKYEIVNSFTTNELVRSFSRLIKVYRIFFYFLYIPELLLSIYVLIYFYSYVKKGERDLLSVLKSRNVGFLENLILYTPKMLFEAVIGGISSFLFSIIISILLNFNQINLVLSFVINESFCSYLWIYILFTIITDILITTTVVYSYQKINPFLSDFEFYQYKTTTFSKTSISLRSFIIICVNFFTLFVIIYKLIRNTLLKNYVLRIVLSPLDNPYITPIVDIIYIFSPIILTFKLLLPISEHIGLSIFLTKLFSKFRGPIYSISVREYLANKNLYKSLKNFFILGLIIINATSILEQATYQINEKTLVVKVGGDLRIELTLNKPIVNGSEISHLYDLISNIGGEKITIFSSIHLNNITINDTIIRDLLIFGYHGNLDYILNYLDSSLLMKEDKDGCLLSYNISSFLGIKFRDSSQVILKYQGKEYNLPILGTLHSIIGYDYSLNNFIYVPFEVYIKMFNYTTSIRILVKLEKGVDLAKFISNLQNSTNKFAKKIEYETKDDYERFINSPFSLGLTLTNISRAFFVITIILLVTLVSILSNVYRYDYALYKLHGSSFWDVIRITFMNFVSLLLFSNLIGFSVGSWLGNLLMRYLFSQNPIIYYVRFDIFEIFHINLLILIIGITIILSTTYKVYKIDPVKILKESFE